MTKEQLVKRIKVAAGEIPADLVIKGGNVVNVFTHQIIRTDVAISDGIIAGLGDYHGIEEYDAAGRYVLPGFIESHIHIESSMLSPEEFGRLIVPCGTTTAIADPHEIVNVCGAAGLEYMVKAAENTALDVKYMIPSCVPSTPYENSGAEVTASEMSRLFARGDYTGLGEFMDVYGVLNTEPHVIDKLITAIEHGRVVDGHAPGLSSKALQAYITAGIRDDHECTTIEEMNERLRSGMYVMLRYGTACDDLIRMAPGVTEENSRRCILASDDRLAATILQRGDLNDSLCECVKLGINPITAVQMATINAAECFGFRDRGGIAPGYRADITLVDNLVDFKVRRVWIEGQLAAADGEYLLPVNTCDSSCVGNSVNVADFSEDRLKLKLKTGRVNIMKLNEGSLITTRETASVDIDETGDFVYNPEKDIVKMAVIERHHGLGTMAACLVRNYGLKKGAIGLTLAHDSHNIIVIGTNNHDMAAAVEKLIDMNGGIVLVDDGLIRGEMPLRIAGIMSDDKAEVVAETLADLQEMAVEEFGVNPGLDSIMTLAFLALPVIPEIKLTDMGLFDVSSSQFIKTELENS